MQRKTTSPSPTRSPVKAVSPPIGGNGNCPSSMACRYPRALISAPTAAVASGSYQVTVFWRGSPQLGCGMTGT